MKLTYLLVATLMTTSLVLKSETAKVKVTGKIKGEIPEALDYTVPLNGLCNFGFYESVSPDKSGQFAFEIDVDRPSFVKLRIWGKFFKTMIVEAGEQYELRIDLEKEENNFRIIGKGEAGQMLYDELELPGFLQSSANPYVEEPDTAVIKEKILHQKKQELEVFRDLLANDEISQGFYDLIVLDRECFYRGLLGSVALIKFFEDYRNKNGIFSEAVRAMWEEAVGNWPAIAEDMARSYWFHESTYNFLNLKEYTDEAFRMEELESLYEKGIIHTHHLEVAEKYLTGKVLEYYAASYIYHEAFQKKYEKELIGMLAQFKADNPDSEYTVYLDRWIDPVIDFHRAVEGEYKAGINFIENGEAIGSLSELVQLLKGKKVYVDVWATWCGPCKEEFAHNAELQELTGPRNVEILYISVDDERRIQQWKDMIKYYDLKGHHIRVNAALEAELRALFGQGGGISIPWYMVFDERGKLAVKHARRPSELKALARELDKI